MDHIDLTPSPAAIELLNRLFSRRVPLFERRASTRTEVLGRLASMTEPALVPHLAVFGLTAKSDERRVVNAIVGSILEGLPVGQLLEFERGVRDRIRMSANRCPHWSTVQPWDLSELGCKDEPAVALIGAFSFHANGYVREGAVRMLDTLETPSALRFVLIRLNDWVPAVRSAAQNAVQRRLTPAHASAFARNIDLIARLMDWGRADHTVLLRWIIEYLRGSHGVAALEAALNEGDVHQRRSLYRVLLKSELESSDPLVRHALADADPICRLIGIRALRAPRVGESIEPWRRALQDRFSAMRVAAARVLSSSFPPESESTFVGLLMDAAPSVRAVARHRLRSLGTIDCLACYVRGLAGSSRRRVCIAIRGVGEVGSAADARLILPSVSRSDPSVAAAALRTLGVLDGDAYIGEFLKALEREESGVLREALRALTPRMRLINLETLWQKSQGKRSVLARKRILALLFRAPKWDSLYYLLTALRDADPEVVAFARVKLDGWILAFNRRAATLSDPQRETLHHALRGVSAVLPPQSQRKLEFFLRS